MKNNKQKIKAVLEKLAFQVEKEEKALQEATDIKNTVEGFKEDKPDTEEKYSDVTNKGDHEMEIDEFGKVKNSGDKKMDTTPKFDKVDGPKVDTKPTAALKEAEEVDVEDEVELSPEEQLQAKNDALDKAILGYVKESKDFDKAQKEFNALWADVIKAKDSHFDTILTIMKELDYTNRTVKNNLVKLKRGGTKDTVSYAKVLELIYEKLTPELKKATDDLKIANTKTSNVADSLSFSKVEESVEIKKIRESIEKISGKKVSYIKESVLSSILGWFKAKFTTVFGKHVQKFKSSSDEFTKLVNGSLTENKKIVKENAGDKKQSQEYKALVSKLKDAANTAKQQRNAFVKSQPEDWSGNEAQEIGGLLKEIWNTFHGDTNSEKELFK